MTAAAAPRVALVHDWLTGMRGGEKVLEALAELFPAAPIHTLVHLPGSVSPAIEAHPIVPSFLQRWPGVRRHYRSYLPLFPAAIEDFDLSGFDLVVSSSHCVAKGAIPAPTARHLCYCHTPVRYAWDQERAYFPRRRGLAARLRNLVMTGIRAWDVASTPRVDRFLANSRFVAERIRRYYGRPAEVVPPPVDVERFAAVASESGSFGPGYALVVSALAPYKRVDLAIAACERLNMELRIVGDGPERRRLERLAAGRTRFLGRVGEDELARLYRGAGLFVQPGVEDFGIAAVEALAAGVPVVALGRGGVLDVVADGEHGVLFADEGCAEALAAAIDKCIRFGFNKLKLEDRARSFSRSRFTERVRASVSGLVEELEAAR